MSEIFLTSFDDKSEIIELNTFKQIKNIDVKKSGFYKYLDGKISALYVENENLFLRYTDTIVKFEDEMQSELIRESNLFTFILTSKKEKLVEFSYNIDFETTGIEAPFSFMEDEDFNWGLFLHNIIKDKKRKNNIIEYYSEL